MQVDFDNEYSKRNFFNHLKGLSGKKEISIKDYKDKRSLNLNDYYWGVVIAMIVVEVQGVDDSISGKSIHEVLKYKFLTNKEVVDPFTGECLNVPISTSELNNKEMWDYIENCKAWAYEFLGLVIPLPKDK